MSSCASVLPHWRLCRTSLHHYASTMTISERQLLDALSRTPFVNSADLAGILGEPHTTVHRTLTDLMTDGIVSCVSHGTAYLPSSQRYLLTANGIGEAAWALGFATPSDFVPRLSCVQAEADVAGSPEGWCSFRLPPRSYLVSTTCGHSGSSTVALHDIRWSGQVQPPGTAQRHQDGLRGPLPRCNV